VKTLRVLAIFNLPGEVNTGIPGGKAIKKAVPEWDGQNIGLPIELIIL
jgi:hypothetical protein